MKKPASFLAAIVALTLAVFSLAGCNTSPSVEEVLADNNNNAPIIDKLLSDTASNMNKNMPMNVDADTRLDNVSALPNKTLRYNFTLVNTARDDLDAEGQAQVEDYLKGQILDGIKGSSDMQALKDAEVTFEYLYKSSDSIELFIFTFGPSDYK
ncbi:MAG: hypothetical protein FWD29_07390 [Micrococcales bacterium]|nr:hypothetical protein [Micrococcales bacterium]